VQPLSGMSSSAPSVPVHGSAASASPVPAPPAVLGKAPGKEDGDLEPYVHSERATCIRDSEGSFDERRKRLARCLQHSLTVTKVDLIQRNIVSGVNVVRRGAHTLEVQLQRRPPLLEMIASRRLPPDYLDKAFPSDPAQSVAPLAERKSRVSLHSLLAQPSSGAPPSVGVSPSMRPQVNPPVGLDPAMFAAMVVQVAMMSPKPPALPGALFDAGPLSQSPPSSLPLLGSVVPGPGITSLPPAQASAPQYPASSGLGVAGVAADAGTAMEVPSPARVQQPQELSPTIVPPMQRPPKPSLQAQRTVSTPGFATRQFQSRPTPFVALLEDFCFRVLGEEAVPKTGGSLGRASGTGAEVAQAL